MKPNESLRVLKTVLRRLLGTRSVPSPKQQKRTTASALVDEIKLAGGGRPLVYLDVGSSGARHPDWQWLLEGGMMKVIAVDLADDWSKQPRKPAGDIIRVKAALGDENGNRNVFITRHPACSSCLRPNFDVLKDYPVREWFDVMREQQVTTTRYDDLSREKALPQPEIAKVDVQGFEGQVLRGMGRVLDTVVCLEFECHLKRLYCGQDTFFELYNFLTRQGFVLRDLEPQGPFEGEAVEFNSFWSRRPKDQRQSEIMRLWETINDLPGPSGFTALNAQQREAYRFND